MTENLINKLDWLLIIRGCGVVDTVPAFQPGGTGSIHGGVNYFNFYPGAGCLFCTVLSCIVFSGGPHCADHTFKEALVYLSSDLVRSRLLPYRQLNNDQRAFGL